MSPPVKIPKILNVTLIQQITLPRQLPGLPPRDTLIRLASHNRVSPRHPGDPPRKKTPRKTLSATRAQRPFVIREPADEEKKNQFPNAAAAAAAARIKEAGRRALRGASFSDGEGGRRCRGAGVQLALSRGAGAKWIHIHPAPGARARFCVQETRGQGMRRRGRGCFMGRSRARLLGLVALTFCIIGSWLGLPEWVRRMEARKEFVLRSCKRMTC